MDNLVMLSSFQKMMLDNAPGPAILLNDAQFRIRIYLLMAMIEKRKNK